MSVSLNAVMAAGNQGSTHAVAIATSFSTTGITIAAGSNRLLVVTIGWQISGGGAPPTGRSVTWNGVAMTEVAFLTAGADSDSVGIYALINPATGAQTLAGSWTTGLDCYVSAVCFNGADQSTGINGSDTVTGSATTISVAGSSDGATLATILRNGATTASVPGRTIFWNYDGLAPGGTGAYDIGTSGSVAFDFSGGSDGGSRALAAVHVIASGGGGGGATNQQTDESSRNRPGRGPLSRGKFFIATPLDVITSQAQSAALAALISAKNVATAALSTSITISASFSAKNAVTPALSSGIATVAALAAQNLATAALTSGIALNSTLAGRNLTLAGLSTGIPLAAFTAGQTTLSATLGAGAGLTAQLFGSAALTSQLTSGIVLGASLAGRAALTDALSSGIPLAAVFGSTASFSAQFGAIPAALVAQIIGKNAVGASLSGGIALVASLNGLCTLSAAPSTGIVLTSALGAVTTVLSALSVAGSAWAASLAIRNTIAAALSTQLRFAADLGVKSAFAGSLTDSFLTGGPRYIIRRIRTRNFTVSSQTYLNFDPKYTDEKVKLTFDFAPDLPAGVTLQGTPLITITTIQGTDPAPASLANGNAGLDVSATQIIVPVQAGVAGCNYDLHAWCATTDPMLTLSLSAQLSVIAP
jgi:hypothetical protein